MYNEDEIMRPKPAPWLEFGAGQSQPQPQGQGGFSFVDALKKRLNQPVMKQGGGHMDAGKIATGASGGGGAPQSL